MPFNLALADLVAPYAVRGENLGANHALLSAIRVVDYEFASDASGVVIRGRCEFNGRGSLDVGKGSFALDGIVDEGAPPFDPNRRKEIFDIRETSLDFELCVPRGGSNIIAAGVDSINDDDFAQTEAVLDIWAEVPAPSDFPASGFTLDLIVNAPTVRPPFFQPAKMTPEGVLVPDDEYQEVTITLPRMRFRLSHNDGLPTGQGSALQLQLLSVGVGGLDDPGDIRVVEAIAMEPPYAFVGRSRDRFIGFAFRKAILDLSDNVTPPAVLEKFGFGDDWGGLYLPEVRLFVAPEGIRDMAFEAGVQDLLIGFGNSKGVSGDFEVALINQGSGELHLGARFFDESGNVYEIERLSPDSDSARVQIPQITRMVVDIEGGREPYTCDVSIGSAEGVDEKLLEGNREYEIDLEDLEIREIRIDVVDSSFGTPVFAVLNIQARQVNEPPLELPAPGDSYPATAEPAVLMPVDGTQPRILIATQTDKTVWVTTEPWNADLIWSVPGSALPEEQEGEESSIFAVELAPGERKTVQARLPETEIAAEETRDFFFYYNEPKPPAHVANEATEFAEYGSVEKNVWTTPAIQETGTEHQLGGSNALAGYEALLSNLPSASVITIVGDASYDGDDSADDRNYDLAIRRAKVVREIIQQEYAAKSFELIVSTVPEGRDAWKTAWRNRSGGAAVSESNPQQRWRATITAMSGGVRPEQSATVELSRPALPPETTEIVIVDRPPAEKTETPSWFRSAKLKLRVVQDELVAFEIGAEVALATAAKEQLEGVGQMSAGDDLAVRSLEGGQPIPVDPDNPADGITQLRLVAQSDSATGETNTLISIGADPADKNGLAMMGWLPGEEPTAPTLGQSLVGSYLSFWPLLVDLSDGNKGDIEDAALDAVKLAIPAAIATLSWFTVERVILHGGEYEKINRNGQSEAFYLFDVEIGWSADISIGATPLISIDPEYPLTVRYKAIGLRFGDIEGNAPYTLQPVFKASRGYTIDVAKSGALKINGTLGRILRVLSARISRTNPLTFEIDVGMSADLGVISIERAAVRAYLNGPEGGSIPRPELTALGARVDIPNTLVGSGYLAINNGVRGQIDLMLVPLKLRISAALDIQPIEEDDGGPATAVYVGIEVILPVGIPLGASGLGIFGFRGIFGMHFQRNESLGSGAVPALGWLQTAEGRPHLISVNNEELWLLQLDSWAFGLGILIGTIEGGVIMNMDGTFLLELPGPRILIMMTARILSPPPGLDELGASSGLLAVIEITPEHFLIGLIAEFEIRELISIVIPIEAFFGFKDPANWHVYLGSRSQPVTVDVLGFFDGTGYLMLKGDGLPAYKELNAIEGFAVGIGAAAALMWGEEEDGLYLRIGGSMDAILGFTPFVLEGEFEAFGELRLYVVSIGAHANLLVRLRENVPEPGEPAPEHRLSLYIHGEACGYIRIFGFKIEGCVEITIRSQPEEPPIPALVKKLSIKSRSPALAVGTGTDRPIDASLGDAVESDDMPEELANLPVVPIDAIPFLSLEMPAQDEKLTFFGKRIGGASGAPAPDGPSEGFVARGEEKYRYELESIAIARVDAKNGNAMGAPFVSGVDAPATWWLLNDINEPNPTAQLGLLTWEPTAASKAIEKTEELKTTVEGRWGQICDGAAPPTPVLWTFRYEKLGMSPLGWELEGIAWPDAEKVNRSEAPDTSLVVSERWRSGDAILDNRRGLVGAAVIGALTPCSVDVVAIELSEADQEAATPSIVVGGRGPVRQRRSNKGQAVGKTDVVRSQLIRRRDKKPFRITPRLHQKVSQIADQLSVSSDQKRDNQLSQLSSKQLNRRLAKGQLSPQDLLQATSVPAIDEIAGTPTQEAPNKICTVKVLQSPQFDNGDPVVFGNPDDQAEIAAALAAAGVVYGPHDDAVRLHTGPFFAATLLLFTWIPLLMDNRLVIRVLDDQGNELREIRPDDSYLLETQGLPARWADTAGPWADDIDDFVDWAAYIASPLNRSFKGLVPILVELSEEEDATQIEISVVPGSIPEYEYISVPDFAPRYYVAAVECLRLSEVRRAQWDESQIQRDRSIITSILGPESSQNAFLHPNSLYRVSATWSSERKRDGAKVTKKTQTFWFQTDDAPPARLDPWMLMTIPADREQQVFYGEPLQLVFNTHDIDRLYDAYGHDLTVRLQSASAHHPPDYQGEQTQIMPPNLKPAGADVLSPWEAALEEVLSDSCIPIDDSREHHSKITLPILFDPFTDYILDIEAVNRDTEATFSVYRRHFSTGGYRHQEEFAHSLSSQFVDHRSVPVGSMAAISNYFGSRSPQGPEFDEQWRSHGLDILPTIEKSRILVLWEQAEDSLPQPAAVLIEATEPLKRSRLYPKLTIDNSGDIPVERWELKQRDWLIVLEPEDSEPIIDAQISVPGNQRILVVLRPDSRGQLLQLNLVGLPFGESYLNIEEEQHSLVKIRFTHAPWEEV